MKNDLKVVQISEANNGYIVTLVEKDRVSELTRECGVYIAGNYEDALNLCKRFLKKEKADEQMATRKKS